MTARDDGEPRADAPRLSCARRRDCGRRRVGSRCRRARGRGRSAGAVRASAPASAATEPFWGAHQGGIVTPAQAHTYFAAFDLQTDKRDDVVKLLRAWTDGGGADGGRPDRRADRRRT